LVNSKDAPCEHGFNQLGHYIYIYDFNRWCLMHPCSCMLVGHPRQKKGGRHRDSATHGWFAWWSPCIIMGISIYACIFTCIWRGGAHVPPTIYIFQYTVHEKYI
jgi:hypothetical protein